MIMAEKKKCPYCGGDIMAVAKKCKHCGKWLLEDNAPKKLVAETKEPIEKVSVASSRKQNKRLLWGCIGIGILIIIGVSYFLLANSNDEKTATQANEEVVMLPVYTLENWNDSLAYAIGLRYAVEKSSGYSLSLNDYIRKHYEKAYGNGNVDGRFKELCEVGYEYGQADKQRYYFNGYAQSFLNCVDCENNILKYEQDIASETNPEVIDRKQKSMKREYERLEFILKNHPDLTYTPHRITNFEQKRDNVMSQK